MSNRPEPGIEVQQQEMEDAWPVHSSAMMTPAQARGALFGSIAGAAVGAVVGALIGLIPFTDLEVLTRVIIVAACAAVAGATLGFILGGGFQPDREGETKGLPGEDRSLGQRRSGQVD